jgi:hypothetical protein
MDESLDSWSLKSSSFWFSPTNHGDIDATTVSCSINVGILRDPMGIGQKVSLEMMRKEHGMVWHVKKMESEWEIHGDSQCRKYQRIDQEK